MCPKSMPLEKPHQILPEEDGYTPEHEEEDQDQKVLQDDSTQGLRIV